MVKTAHHPDGVHVIRFREHNHSYIDNYGSRYVSGTSFFKPFFPKFDAAAIALKCSKGINPKYAGRDPLEIRAEWLAEGKRGSDEGNNVHLYAELYPVSNGHPNIAPLSDRCADIFLQVEDAFIELIMSRGYQIIGSELIVFSPDMLVAGTIDLLLYDPAARQIIIADWKQNKAELTIVNHFQNLLAPFEYLQDTEINKYSLQLSIYQYILIKEKYFPELSETSDFSGYRRLIIHLSTTTATYIELDYYEYEIKEIIK